MNGLDRDLPSPTGLDYEEVNSWASQDLEQNLQNSKSRELFTKFLETCLAAENIRFIQAVQDFETTKSGNERKTKAKRILKRYSSKLNIEPVLQEEVVNAARQSSPPVESYARTKDHVMTLLKSDLFPRYLKSDLYLGFVEQFLPRETLQRWTKNLESLLGNTVGRWKFRKFLRRTHADETLRFIEAVTDYKKADDNVYRKQKARSIYNQYLADEAPTQVHILDKDRREMKTVIFEDPLESSYASDISEKEIDKELFDESVRSVVGHLRDPYLRFLQSKDFTSLLEIATEREKSAEDEISQA